MIQPPKMSPLALVSAGMAMVCKQSAPCGAGSSVMGSLILVTPVYNAAGAGP